MVFCAKCGQELSETANFCLKCGVRTKTGIEQGVSIPSDWLTDSLTNVGQEIEKAFTTAAKEVEKALTSARDKIKETATTNRLTCPSCGEEGLRSDAKFCYKCGKSISQKAE